MWRIHYSAAGEKTVRVDTVATEAEMLTAVRHVYRSPEFCVQCVEGPEGKKLNAAQAGLFSMLMSTKPAQSPAARKPASPRSVAPRQAPSEAESQTSLGQITVPPRQNHVESPFK
ncbi:MAG: hypothetical protein JWN94_4253 [Betaproteobacteria bacterium]|nr:hypothetical protein [Betaproteobacteria bacterium]